ncbi:nuclear transport factor 2 family protein [Sphingomonas sp. M1-B02]|uniref:nuclear transport factor 2 family protein n=1 Tax=Sphingomonas sp. M1-B02 TaxID=3114300 RepID=UPI00224030AB|nr:nuclear transport factor 2 family protein [Sphingomonas sp. S6-11]UZK66359.1 nuclear transport factor 2 family protein [Sphingomonas sp. S6-11]
MKSSHRLAIALAAAAMLPATVQAMPVQTADASDAALVALARSFVDAQANFDQKRLSDLTTDDYVEISPVGEVDPKAEFIGFYAPDKKRAVPTTALSEPLVRHYGNAASIIARLGFDVPLPDGTSRSVAVRVTYLAIRSGTDWKLASAHYTPVRTPPAAAATPR